MDWGLFVSHSKNALLRDELVFNRWVRKIKILRVICVNI